MGLGQPGRSSKTLVAGELAGRRGEWAGGEERQAASTPSQKNLVETDADKPGAGGGRRGDWQEGTPKPQQSTFYNFSGSQLGLEDSEGSGRGPELGIGRLEGKPRRQEWNGKTEGGQGPQRPRTQDQSLLPLKDMQGPPRQKPCWGHRSSQGGSPGPPHSACGLSPQFSQRTSALVGLTHGPPGKSLCRKENS